MSNNFSRRCPIVAPCLNGQGNFGIRNPMFPPSLSDGPRSGRLCPGMKSRFSGIRGILGPLPLGVFRMAPEEKRQSFFRQQPPDGAARQGWAAITNLRGVPCKFRGNFRGIFQRFLDDGDGRYQVDEIGHTVPWRASRLVKDMGTACGIVTAVGAVLPMRSAA